MKTLLPFLTLVLSGITAASARPALTIYNQNFATVRDQVQLQLRQGTNDVSFPDTTAHVEPDSVILRDPSGKVDLRVLEQNYRNDPVSAGLLLSLNEGKEIGFFIPGTGDKPDRTVMGRIIRSGYTPHSQEAMQRYGNDYRMNQMSLNQALQPIIEVNGQLQFSLPGNPLFPALADDTILKPTLGWKLHSDQAANLNAEVSYLTGGMSWDAAYNLIAPENGDTLTLTGWVTMDNQSGKSFQDAKIQLVAGDVAKIQRNEGRREIMRASMADSREGGAPAVTEKSFDEYHLYSLPLPTTLHDRETKQVEFVRAENIKASRIYVYDGAQIDFNRWGRTSMMQIRENPEYGTESNPKVRVMRELRNSRENQLGIPLPKGVVRFYRQDEEGQQQFTGENLIDHTPADETLRIYTGNAFDITGERKRTDFNSDNANHRFNETFTITLRNHKKEAAEVRVVEHLYRWTNWEILQPSGPFRKTDAQTIEFRIPLQPDEEKTLSYQVRYSW